MSIEVISNQHHIFINEEDCKALVKEMKSYMKHPHDLEYNEWLLFDCIIFNYNTIEIHIDWEVFEYEIKINKEEEYRTMVTQWEEKNK